MKKSDRLRPRNADRPRPSARRWCRCERHDRSYITHNTKEGRENDRGAREVV